MNTVVINEEAARAILAAGGFTMPTRRRIWHTAFNLDRIAHALITDHLINRQDDRGRPRRLPRPKARREFHTELESLWIDLPGIRRLPTVTYSRGKEYGGNYVRFVQAVAGTIADYLEPYAQEPLWNGLRQTMRRLQRGGGDGINPVSTTIRQIANREYLDLSHIQTIVLGILERHGGKSNPAEIASELHKPEDEVKAVLTQLIRLGRVKRIQS